MTFPHKMNLANLIAFEPQESLSKPRIGRQLFATRLRISKYNCVAEKDGLSNERRREPGKASGKKANCGQVISTTRNNFCRELHGRKLDETFLEVFRPCHQKDKELED